MEHVVLNVLSHDGDIEVKQYRGACSTPVARSTPRYDRERVFPNTELELLSKFRAVKSPLETRKKSLEETAKISLLDKWSRKSAIVFRPNSESVDFLIRTNIKAPSIDQGEFVSARGWGIFRSHNVYKYSLDDSRWKTFPKVEAEIQAFLTQGKIHYSILMSERSLVLDP